MKSIRRRKSHEVKIRGVKLGKKNPIAVQSMNNTNTADVQGTVEQAIQLYDAGSELLRFTVENEAMAKAILPIRNEMDKRGYDMAPIIGDFHYNGHILLSSVPECAETLDKYRINPGNVGFGEQQDRNFKAMVDIAIKYDKPVRIGVNWGSLDQQILKKMIDEDLKAAKPKGANVMVLEAMVESALQSAQKAEEYGMGKEKIVLSAKASDVREFLYVNRLLAKKCDYALHVGITEAGTGTKGIVTAAQGVGLLLNEGIGDTIRTSITQAPGEPRTKEVIVSQQILQSLGIRKFTPTITSCPGCGRTTSTLFQKIAAETTRWLQEKMPEWKAKGYVGMEEMHVAVMGCIVNGPGESKYANIGMCLPGSGENPTVPVFADGKQVTTLKGEEAEREFPKLIEKYVEEHYASGKKSGKKR